MTGRAKPTLLTARQRSILEKLSRTRTLAQHLAERCHIVLGAAAAKTDIEQAQALGIDRQRVRRWRWRWSESHQALTAAEAQDASDADLEARILSVLSDSERSGAPPKFTPEQVVAIVALACEPPAESERPISHWTPVELAAEAVKRGIVTSISPRQVDRFLVKRT